MEKKVTGILIDPHARSIEEVELSKTKLLEDLYTVIDCDLVDKVSLEEMGDYPHDVVVDDEGLYSGGEVKYFHLGKFTPYSILAGRGVIVAVTPTGNWRSHKLDIDMIRKNTKFLNRREAAVLADELGI